MSEQAPETSTRASVAKSTLLLGLVQAWKMILGFGSTVILARLLAPSDFGLIAMIWSAMALIMLFQDLGLAQAVIQRQDLQRQQVGFLYWCTAGVSVTLAAIMFAGAPLLAAFYGEERLVDLSRAFACLIVMGGLQSIPMALLTRKSRFKTIAILEAVSATSGFVVAVTAAFVWRSYWALFASALVTAVLSLAGAWLTTGFRPGPPKFDQGARELLRFGGSLTGFSFVNYFSRNMDNILLGRYHGSVELGFYDRAYRLLLFPIAQVHGPVGRVMVPLLSRLQSNPAKYRQGYLECVTLILTAAQPGIAFMIVFAKEIFDVVLGERWANAVPIFQVLGIVSLHQIMTSTFGWLYISQARGGEFFRVGTVTSSVTVLAFILGLPWGGVGLAVAYCISEYVQLPFIWAKMGSRGPVGTRDLFGTAIPQAIACVVTILLLTLIHRSIGQVGLLAYFLIGCLSYAAYLCVLLCWSGKRHVLAQGAHVLVNARFAIRSAS